MRATPPLTNPDLILCRSKTLKHRTAAKYGRHHASHRHDATDSRRPPQYAPLHLHYRLSPPVQHGGSSRGFPRPLATRPKQKAGSHHHTARRTHHGMETRPHCRDEWNRGPQSHVTSHHAETAGAPQQVLIRCGLRCARVSTLQTANSPSPLWAKGNWRSVKHLTEQPGGSSAPCPRDQQYMLRMGKRTRLRRFVGD